MTSFLATSPSSPSCREPFAALRTCLDEVARAQAETREAAWTVVRIITDRPLLVVEYALEGLLAPEERPQWAYQAARPHRKV